ncbi:MAG: hypothetical protein J6O39_03940 [Treponema sp.]|nr:hypothetical protein [Treponema sp.]
MMKTESNLNDAWYAQCGSECDVALSTKVRLSRNLANFPFPARLSPGEGDRIQAILLDAFNKVDGENFHAINISALDKVSARIMAEREILDDELQTEGGIILRNDGRFSGVVNVRDHICISSYNAGFEVEKAYSAVSEFDDELQKYVQFAASYDFGYLNSSLVDSGSGMRICVRLHLPSLSLLKRIPALVRECSDDGFVLSASFGSGGASAITSLNSASSALGFFYNLENVSSVAGSELEQTAGMASEIKKIIDMERNARTQVFALMKSDIRNGMKRSVAIARASVFITLREAIDIISMLKFAKDLGVLSGIDDEQLHALLYRIQNGHLEFVMKSGSFKFENDVDENPVRKVEKLRALTLQESFENIVLSV